MSKLFNGLLFLGGLAVTCMFASPVYASTFSFIDTRGTVDTSDDRSATASFEEVSSDLVVTLTNTGGDALVPVDVLTALFFDCTGCNSLTTVNGTALLAAGSSIIYPPASPAPAVDPVYGVGGEWAYKGGISGPDNTDFGLSSTGVGIFGKNDVFPGADLSDPDAPNGLNYGIVSSSDNSATGNGGLVNDPLIKGAVVFTLPGLADTWSITNVFFQYGTALDEPRYSGCLPGQPGCSFDTPVEPVPLPAGILFLLSGIFGLGFLGRYRRNAEAT